jgi:hypothetical protein
MFKRIVAALALTLLAAAGWALAQQGQTTPRAENGTAGRFSLVASGNTTVLLDTATGKTWLLSPSGTHGAPFWFPVPRIDSVRDVNVILRAQEEYRAIAQVITREAERRKAAQQPAPKTEK